MEKRRWGEPRWKAAAVTGICLDVARKPLHPGRAQRWPVSDFPPLWTCREAQGVGRAEGSAACPQLRALACCGCSNGAAQQQSEFRSTAPRPSIAGCPQRSGGTRQAGSPFLCLLSFGEAKESRSAAGPRPGLCPQQLKRTSKRIAASADRVSASRQKGPRKARAQTSTEPPKPNH